MVRSGDLGWAGPGIWVRGEGLETSQKGESRKEMGPDGRRAQSSCAKLRVVMAVLLVVAVCQNTLSEIKINANMIKAGITDLRIYSDTSFGRPSQVGGLLEGLEALERNTDEEGNYDSGVKG